MRAHEFIIEGNQTANQFMNYITGKYSMKAFLIHDYDSETIKLTSIIVNDKKQGIGTDVMNELIGYADSSHKRILLDVGTRDDHHGTTSRNRLVKFYKRFGFYENKGRKKDFSISAEMVRDPQTVNEFITEFRKNIIHGGYDVSEKVIVAINPTSNELVKFAEKSKMNILRGYFDQGKFYFWDGWSTIHKSAVEQLGLEYDSRQRLTFETGVNPDTGDKSWVLIHDDSRPFSYTTEPWLIKNFYMPEGTTTFWIK